MAGSVCDPELLAKHGGRVDDEFLFLLVIRGRGLHLRRIVTVAELGEAEAAHVLERADFAHERQVALRVQCHQ